MKDTLGDTPWQPPSYPASPGYRGPASGPSARAAAKIASRAKSISQQILALPRLHQDGMTSDEIAAALEMPNLYSSRPRVAELHRQGEIVDSGQQRRGQSGLMQTIWKIAPPLPDYPHLHGGDR